MIIKENKVSDTFSNSFINFVPNLIIKLISSMFVIPLRFLAQLKKLLKTSKTSLYLFYYKNDVNCRQGSCLLFHICHFRWYLKEIKRLDIKKATQEIDIPTKTKTQFPVLIKNINCCRTEGTFRNDFKKAVEHQTQKKDCKIELSNYKLISHITSCHISQKCIQKFLIEHLRTAASG